MEKNRKSRMFAVVIAVPLLLLFIAISVNQTYLIPVANDPPPNNDLQLLGYGYHGSSLTLMNVGDKQLTILNVTFDGRLLTQGKLGGTMPMFASAQNQSSSLCYVTTDDLVFPQGEHWNMDTGGLCIPTISPGELATLYLGVFSNTNSSHIVLISTQEGYYNFTV